jgi:hypothetical protein
MTCGGGCWCWSVLLVVCVLVLISVSREPDSLVMDNKTVAMRAIPSLSRVTIMITSHGIMAWSPAYVHHPLCLQPARSAAPVAIHATLCRLTGPDHRYPSARPSLPRSLFSLRLFLASPRFDSDELTLPRMQLAHTSSYRCTFIADILDKAIHSLKYCTLCSLLLTFETPNQ